MIVLRRLVIAALVLSISCGAASRAATPFTPLSFTAIGESDYWVLGNDSVLHTTDGGAHFARLPEPPLAGERGTIRFLRFVDAEDGYAYVPRGSFAVTHDGGRSWRTLNLGAPLAFATGGGLVHVVFAQCTNAGCASLRFATSPVTTDDWHVTPLPFAAADSLVALAAHGRDVWLLGSRGNRSSAREVLARSSAGGATFTVGAAPCTAGLGGQLLPASATALWAVCPTGMMAQAWRSTDGGATFANLRGLQLVNSAQLAPASSTTAVVAGNGAGSPLLRTVDAGRTWTRAAVPVRPLVVQWVGFTDPRVGAAIVSTATGTELWRTTDAGASWSRVRL